MSLEEKAEKAIEIIDKQLTELEQIDNKRILDHKLDVARESLKRWEIRTAKLISNNIHPKEG